MDETPAQAQADDSKPALKMKRVGVNSSRHYADFWDAQMKSIAADRLIDVQSLIVNNRSMRTLDGFPYLPLLKRLEITCDFSEGWDVLPEKCPNLEKLTLPEYWSLLHAVKGEKKETYMAQILPFKRLHKLQSLRMLSRFRSSAAKDYRKAVFEFLPQLKFLDGLSSELENEPSDDEDWDSDPCSSDDDYDSQRLVEAREEIRSLKGCVERLEKSLIESQRRNESLEEQVASVQASLKKERVDFEREKNMMMGVMETLKMMLGALLHPGIATLQNHVGITPPSSGALPADQTVSQPASKR